MQKKTVLALSGELCSKTDTRIKKNIMHKNVYQSHKKKKFNLIKKCTINV